MSTIGKLAAAVLVGLPALAGCATAHPARPAAVLVADNGNSFSITAPDVSGLYPGTARNLLLTVTNPFGFAISVTDLWGQLDRVSPRTCVPAPSNLMVQAHAGGALPLTVPPRSGRAAGWIPLYMPNTVAEACQRATFTISLHGTAKKAGGS
jgi:hypothetical protein